MRVRIIRERCCGSGNCVVIAPEVFDHDPVDGRVIVLCEDPATELIDDVRDAADSCPTQSIRVENTPTE